MIYIHKVFGRGVQTFDMVEVKEILKILEKGKNKKGIPIENLWNAINELKAEEKEDDR